MNSIYEDEKEVLHGALREAAQLGLVTRSDDTYSFTHDRIQQAAYALIPNERRAEAHLRIGRALLASMTTDQLDERLFDVANQLQRGAALINDHDEKLLVASIHARAGRKAKASAAYASALVCFSAGTALLGESDWLDRHELTFSLWLERAECEFLTGNLEGAKPMLAQLLARATSKIESADVYNLSIQLQYMKGEIQQSVNSALECLGEFGIEIPAHPTEEQVQTERDALRQTLERHPLESLIDLPLMGNAELQAAMRVFSAVLGPASHRTDLRLCCFLACRMVALSAEHGTSEGSASAYSYWGSLLQAIFHRDDEGYRFGKLACDVVEKHGFVADQALAYLSVASQAAWTQPIGTAIEFARKGIRAAIETGKPFNACVGMCELSAYLLLRNDPLDAVWLESELALAFVRARQADYAEIILSQQRFIRTMQGRSITFSAFGDTELDEATFESRLTTGRMPRMVGIYWILKMKTRFLSGDHAEALAALDKATPLLEAFRGSSPTFDYFYYSSLTMTALYDTAPPGQQQAWRDLLTAHCEQLREWAESYPPTFGDKHALVSAEIARIEKRDTDAMRLYEQAIRSAREQGFVKNEGVALELAAQFYAARGVETVTGAYLRAARHCYARWGAQGKVQQLERLYPHLATAPKEPTPASLNANTVTPVEQLDAETVARASQALSSEIVLPKLIERLMRIAVEHAGAERGLLILFRGHEPQIEAEARTGDGRVDVDVRQADVTSSALPTSALKYVMRTQERVVIDDASLKNSYWEDEYLAQKNAKSVLLLPIVKQAKLLGVLYMENNLAPHVFTSGRMAVLDMLASQAAISLENARLYAALEQENAERRHAEDALKKSETFLTEGQRISHIGSWAWNLANDEMLWSEEHCRIFGYEVDQVGGTLAGVLQRLQPESRATLSALRAAVRAGQSFSCEYQVVLPDGSNKYVQTVGRGMVDGAGNVSEAIGTTADITERKRAEEELRRNETALREAQAELAHVARVTTLGEFSASIAHEVRQPITGILLNGNTCLRLLDRVNDGSESLAQVRVALQRIVRDANRAGDIMARIRSLFQRTESPKEPLNLNETIREILMLARSEVEKQRVTLRLELSPHLPNVLGDRVQLQQVLLNLILNSIDAMTTVEDRARELVIATQTDDEQRVQVTVRDSGIGLPLASVEDAFKAFHTTKPNGLGMGLPISRSIVESHAGRLWLTTPEGPGASFHFALPTVSQVEV